MNTYPSISGQKLLMGALLVTMLCHALLEPRFFPTCGFRKLTIRQAGTKYIFEPCANSNIASNFWIQFQAATIPKDKTILIVEQGEAFRHDVEGLKQPRVRGTRLSFCAFGF